LEKGDRFIAMELLEMSLFDLIKKHKQKGEHFSIPVVVDMMVQVARGVCYLHSQGVAHRDLKPQNVVVSHLNTQQLEDQYYVKLVDFGVSKVEVEASKPNTMTACGIGTTMYRAPEVHPKANPNSKGIGKVNWLKADAFSFAMTCAHLLSLETPFQDLQPSELYNEVTKNEIRPTIH
jgi:serine/threonine protein kinase